MPILTLSTSSAEGWFAPSGNAPLSHFLTLISKTMDSESGLAVTCVLVPRENEGLSHSLVEGAELFCSYCHVFKDLQ